MRINYYTYTIKTYVFSYDFLLSYVLQERKINMTFDNFHESQVERAVEHFIEEAQKKATTENKGLTFQERLATRSMALAHWASLNDAKKIHAIQHAFGLQSNKKVPNGFVWHWRRASIAPRDSEFGNDAQETQMKPAPMGSCRIVIRSSRAVCVKYVSDE